MNGSLLQDDRPGKKRKEEEEGGGGRRKEEKEGEINIYLVIEFPNLPLSVSIFTFPPSDLLHLPLPPPPPPPPPSLLLLPLTTPTYLKRSYDKR